jgi:hypothetical protein
MLVLVSKELVIMCPATAIPATCEILALIHFLQAKTSLLRKSTVNNARQFTGKM